MNSAGMSLDAGRIERAATLIDPCVRDSPQFACASLNAGFGLDAVLKVETVNPLRSFKGRGGDLLMQQADRSRTVVCASAGNLGQGLAWAGARHGVGVRIFSSASVPEGKLARMRDFGAEVMLVDGDFDDAKRAAEEDALRAGRFVVDGIDIELAEGAGTIGVELTRDVSGIDAAIVPVGNGSLAAGVATWLKAVDAGTRVIAVGATGAPAMRDAWVTGDLVVGPPTRTCAEGLAARAPVADVIATLRQTVDEFVLVDDEELIAAMRALHEQAGLVVEASGAAPLAAAARLAESLRGARVALIIGGGNASAPTLTAALGTPRGQTDAVSYRPT